MKHPGNASAAVLCLLASCALAWWGARSLHHSEIADEAVDHVIDASGHRVPAGDYRRIACASTIAAEIVPELVPLDRIILVPNWFVDGNPRGWRTNLLDRDGQQRIAQVDVYAGIESLIAHRSDLIIINTFVAGGSERVQRLRDLGHTVLDLGEMRGVATLLPQIRQLGVVLQQPQRAEALATGLERRLRTAAAHVPEHGRKTALYIGVMGGSLSGGTEGSSHHDLLHFAGLIDAAAGHGFNPWPSYTPEQVVTLDPDLIVTDHGRADELRAVPGFDRLRAVRDPAGIIELPADTETSALGLLPAVEFLCDAVYGPPPDSIPGDTTRQAAQAPGPQ